MYTLRQMADPVIAARIAADRREGTPTPVWHLAKSANVDEKTMVHHLGKLGIDVYRWGSDMALHIKKADARKLMGIEGEL
jgi:hypothetical protein